MITRIFFLLLLASGLCLQASTPKLVSLFNGKDLSGWDGDPKWWTVEDGVITAESTPEKPCKKTNYLVWTGGLPSDFTLVCDFKISEAGNSGIHIRSERRPDYDMYGYQADITGDGKLIGFIYHHKRGLVAERGEKVAISRTGERKADSIGDGVELLKHYKPNQWNRYRIICIGDTLTLYLNDVKMCVVEDLDPETKKALGYIGLQMHRGEPMKVQFKNIHLISLAARPETRHPTVSQK